MPDYTTEFYTEDEPVYRQEPVYDTRYYYDIDKWEYERSEVTSGTDKSPYWATLELTDKERESERYTKYTMSGILHYHSFGKDREKNITYDIQESWWREINNGQTLTLTLEGDTLTGWDTKK